MRPWIVVAAFYGATGVAFAAWASHGLAHDAYLQGLAERASLFQLLHAPALLAADRLAAAGRRAAGWAAGAFAFGVLLFSGSLALKVLGGTLPVPMVTPAGGVLLMLGWLLLGVAGMRSGTIPDDV